MIDRRFFVAIAVVVVGALGLRAATLGSSVPAAELAPDPGTPPASPHSTMGETPDATVRVDVIEESPTRSTVAVAEASESSTVLDVDVLVESRRPAIDAIRIPADHHHDDGAGDPSGGQVSSAVEAIAAKLVGAGWTWRFDDAASRQVGAVAPVASARVMAVLVPSGDELQRRADTAEVSWVVISDIVVDGSWATVTFDQHVVTSTIAETITTRSVAVFVAGGVVVEVSP